MTQTLLRFVIFLCFVLSIQHLGSAQSDGGSTNTFSTPGYEKTDSLTSKDSVIVKNAFFKIFKGKPGRAALYSLLIPGGGQLYNQNYWKFPIAVGIDGGLAYNIWYQTSQYNTYQRLYQNALVTGDTNLLVYKANRDTFRKSKEFSWLYLLLGHILTTLDAYVERHLMEFDISPDLTLISIPGQNTVALGIKIPLYKQTYK